MPVTLRSRKIPPSGDSDLNVDGNLEGKEEEEFEVLDSDQAALLTEEEMPDVHIRGGGGIKGDERNIAVLLFLYVLQGIPLGLAAAVPLILTNRNISYREQAEFSFAYWPFSVKLLWAPIVDSCFVSSFGRRKTWLVPVQYLIGITMLLLSANVDFYLGDKNPKGAPEVFKLTCMFFFLNFLAATQDIAVDGWALTMLQRRNVGYASTCNAVGQTAGYFLGYVGYMVLESYGIVTLPDFLFFWGIVFFISTTFVAIFKHEKTDSECEVGGDDEELELGVKETYQVLFKIITLPLMPSLIAFLLTSKVGFSAADAVSSLKLIEAGVPKDKLAMLAIPIMPLQILLPWVISRYTTGKKPMDIYLKAMAPRLIMGLVFMAVVYVTPWFKNQDGSFPVHFYGITVGLYVIHQVFLYSMFVSIMSFFAKISDPAVGGTYMTLLNTLTNLGGNWPATLALWWVDVLTVKECNVSGSRNNLTLAQEELAKANRCQGAEATKVCTENLDGTCETQVEGYYIESIACVIVGFAWLCLWGSRTMKRLQDAPDSEWRVVKASSRTPKRK